MQHHVEGVAMREWTMQECSNACENVLKTSYKSADAFMPTKITGKIDGADEDVAQKTDHTPPQDDA